MPALLERFMARTPEPVGERGLSISDYMQLVSSFSYNSMTYPLGSSERPGGAFLDLVNQVHTENNVVSAAIVARGLLLKQVRFAWRNQRRNDPKYRQLFGDSRLSLLERPDPGRMTRPQWLAAAEFHASYAGAMFTANRGDWLEPLAPDLVDVVIEGPDDAEAVVLRKIGRKKGYLYYPNGREHPESAEPLTLAEVMHWTPEPHPVKWWTGQSWVLSVLAEVTVDKSAGRFLQNYMDQSATPNMIIKPHESLTVDQVKEYKEIFAKETAGSSKAGKTLWLGAGSDAQVVGSNISELDLRNVTGGGETRIALRARVPASILGVRESLQGSSLNAGNYTAARRMFADGWFTPTVQDLCASAETILPATPGTELWYDPADVLFLQEDALDAAEIIKSQASTIRTLVDGGFKPDVVIAAVRDGNLAQLEGGHTGLTSVQLLPPGTGADNNA